MGKLAEPLAGYHYAYAVAFHLARDPRAAALIPPIEPGQRVPLGRVPYADGSFGLVLLFTTLSSLASGEDVLRALREARRVLAPRGRVPVYEPRVPNPLNRSTRWIRRAALEEGLGGPVASHPLTPVPALLRVAGRRAPATIPALMRLPLPRTHALWLFRGGG